VKNIADLRALLMAELEALNRSPTAADMDRIRLTCALTDRVIDLTRLEVQLAAVMRGSLEVPFIESQAPERKNDSKPLPAPSLEDAQPLTALQRAARVLSGGPSPSHPWRPRSDKERD
jgi:hypothetical protein